MSIIHESYLTIIIKNQEINILKPLVFLGITPWDTNPNLCYRGYNYIYKDTTIATITTDTKHHLAASIREDKIILTPYFLTPLLPYPREWMIAQLLILLEEYII